MRLSRERWNGGGGSGGHNSRAPSVIQAQRHRELASRDRDNHLFNGWFRRAVLSDERGQGAEACLQNYDLPARGGLQ